MDAKTGLFIQFFGISIITILMEILRQPLKLNTLTYWTWAWKFLNLALLSLLLAFHLDYFTDFFYSFYFFGEYVFCYLLIAGCKSYSIDRKLNSNDWFALIPALFLAFVIPFLGEDFSTYFYFHVLVITVFLTVAFFTLKPQNSLQKNNFGRKVLRFSLVLLALNFFSHFLLFLTQQKFPLLEIILSYNSIIDLLLEILLGFGMMMVLLEQTKLEVEDANIKLQETHQKLREAHEKLEQTSQIDPLTTAFNRHAFHIFLKKHGEAHDEISGCVGVFDIDNLKPINDRFGHAFGDLAIRSVSGAIRSLIRSDDLLFRWGGDEFFIILVGMETNMAQERFENLEYLLQNIRLNQSSETVSVKVSFGFADFKELNQLEAAVNEADEKMYLVKQNKKKSEKYEQEFNTKMTV